MNLYSKARHCITVLIVTDHADTSDKEFQVLLSSVRGTKKPIVVHCSAGIGRTGAIVAIEFILEKLQEGIPCESMDQILKELRNQRPYSIQNDMVRQLSILF